MRRTLRQEAAASEAFDRLLNKSTPADFDGHTAFLSLTSEQRLDALGQMIALVAELKGKARKTGHIDVRVADDRR